MLRLACVCDAPGVSGERGIAALVMVRGQVPGFTFHQSERTMLSDQVTRSSRWRVLLALALVSFAGLRERFVISHIPEALEGTAIGLVTAGIMSLAFLGFLGMT